MNALFNEIGYSQRGVGPFADADACLDMQESLKLLSCQVMLGPKKLGIAHIVRDSELPP